MHAVQRGEEPAGLEAIRTKYTPRWVDHYRHGRGGKPGDSRWREFQPALSEAFFYLCGYCEQACDGEVDHFRPKSRFPEKVYEWSNWVLACHTCNHNKAETWPSGGYVDPCAKTATAQPEAYFRFDTKTAEILPKPGLSAYRRRKALQTIADLELNAYYRLKSRMQWLTAVEHTLADNDAGDPDHTDLIRYITPRDREFSSITRAFLRERGYALEGQ